MRHGDIKCSVLPHCCNGLLVLLVDSRRRQEESPTENWLGSGLNSPHWWQNKAEVQILGVSIFYTP
jgi:hypothetical protein